jgi:hypothetical protein
MDLALMTLGGAGLLAWAERAPRDLATQPATRPGAETTTPPIPRSFDAVFAAHGQGIPVPYLRALAWNESRLDPRATSRASSATGLLQVVDVVRSDHNRLYGTAYTREDLADPTINVTIAATALRRIIRSYERNHPSIPNLLEDWNSYPYAELLTQGWNSGWSERAGVGRVVRYLAELGTTNVTAALVHQHALAAGATRHLADPNRLAWAEKVARHYAAERAREAAPLVARNARVNAARRFRIECLFGPDEPPMPDERRMPDEPAIADGIPVDVQDAAGEAG